MSLPPSVMPLRVPEGDSASIGDLGGRLARQGHVVADIGARAGLAGSRLAVDWASGDGRDMATAQVNTAVLDSSLRADGLRIAAEGCKTYAHTLAGIEKRFRALQGDAEAYEHQLAALRSKDIVDPSDVKELWKEHDRIVATNHTLITESEAAEAAAAAEFDKASLMSVDRLTTLGVLNPGQPGQIGQALFGAVPLFGFMGVPGGPGTMGWLNGGRLQGPGLGLGFAPGLPWWMNAGTPGGVQSLMMLADPRAVNKWWDGLSAGERGALVTASPEFVGPMAGLPAVARNEANRILIDRMLDDDRLVEELGDKRVQTLKHIQGLGEEYFILKLDPDGDGRTIISLGNPDTADDTGILVPGMTTDLDSAKDQLYRIGQMHVALGGGDNVATIWWLDYDPPDSGGVVFDDAADAGAPALSRFAEGLRVTNPHSYNSVMAHSYGGLTTGRAAADHGLDVDAVMWVGNVGIGVDHASELHLDDAVLLTTKGGSDVPAAAEDLIYGGAGADAQAAGVPSFRSQWSTGHSDYWNDPKVMKMYGQMGLDKLHPNPNGGMSW